MFDQIIILIVGGIVSIGGIIFLIIAKIRINTYEKSLEFQPSPTAPKKSYEKKHYPRRIPKTVVAVIPIIIMIAISNNGPNPCRIKRIDCDPKKKLPLLLSQDEFRGVS